MQRISRAPELSATLSLDSCWIMDLPGPLQHFDQAPALGPRHRSRLDHPHDVPRVRGVRLVVGVDRRRAPDHLLVDRMTADDLDPHSDRLVGPARDDGALAYLPRPGLAVG